MGEKMEFTDDEYRTMISEMLKGVYDSHQLEFYYLFIKETIEKGRV